MQDIGQLTYLGQAALSGLEQHDDKPRAEVIRIGVQLGRSVAEPFRHPRLVFRAKGLTRRYSKSWRRELPRLPGVGWNGRFEAGLFCFVSLRAPVTFDREAGHIRDSQPVWRFLFSSDLGAKQLSLLLRSKHLHGIGALDLASDGIDTAGIRLMGRADALSQLTVLDLSSNRYDALGLEAVVSLPSFARLRTLKLCSVNSPSDLASWPRVSRDPGLQSLAVHGHVGDQGADAVARCQWLSSLRHLDIAWVGPRGLGSLASSPHLDRLQTLDLNGSPLGDAGLKILSRSRGLAGLEHLTMYGIGAGDKGLEALGRWPGLNRLKTLILTDNMFRGNQFTGKGIAALARSPYLEHLETLVLARDNLGDEAAVALAEAPSLSRLVVLSLTTNEIGDRGVEALAGSSMLKSLKALYLGGNPIGTRGVAALAASPLANRLEALDIPLNDAAGAALLARSSGLDDLQLLQVETLKLPDVARGMLKTRFGRRLQITGVRRLVVSIEDEGDPGDEDD